MSVAAPTRLTPVGRMNPFRAHRIWERNLLVARRLWSMMVSGFFEPVFYLFSIGIGLGALVGDVAGPDGNLISYTTFVAPALMAASAMNGTVIETTFNIFFKLRFSNTYEGILTTPMSPRDIAIGEIGWALFRGALYATAFVVVMAVMGAHPFVVGLRRDWGRHPHRIRVRGSRAGGDDLHAVMAGLRPRPTGDNADVPILGDLLSPGRVPASSPAISSHFAALPRHGTAQRPDPRDSRLDSARSHRVPPGHGLDRPCHRQSRLDGLLRP